MVLGDNSASKPTLPNIEESPRPAPAEPLSPDLILRLRQQEILSELGVFALQHTSLQELLDTAVRMAAEGLQSDLCKILEYISTENRFLLRAGVGWDPGLVGVATVGADMASPSGYAMRTGKPVISNHLENEERFRTPELLRAHGVRRAINVILQGDGTPFGVLEIDSRSEGEFTENDISFLQGAANILGMAIERQRYEHGLRAAVEHQQVLISEINHRVKNSLQLVGSMFHLQAKSTKDAILSQALEEAQGRVAAVARVHERLYRDAEVKVIDLSKYLKDVCDDLRVVIEPCEIDFKAEERIRMGPDRAVIIALVIGELVTNSAKHAYSKSYPGQIEVEVSRVGDVSVSISVRDDGCGLPNDFDIQQTPGFGMAIVRAFLQQSGAKLDVRQEGPGAEFHIEVPLE